MSIVNDIIEAAKTGSSYLLPEGITSIPMKLCPIIFTSGFNLQGVSKESSIIMISGDITNRKRVFQNVGERSTGIADKTTDVSFKSFTLNCESTPITPRTLNAFRLGNCDTILFEDLHILNSHRVAIQVNSEGNPLPQERTRNIMIRNTHLQNCGLGDLSFKGMVESIAIHYTDGVEVSDVLVENSGGAFINLGLMENPVTHDQLSDSSVYNAIIQRFVGNGEKDQTSVGIRITNWCKNIELLECVAANCVGRPLWIGQHTQNIRIDLQTSIPKILFLLSKTLGT